jgi:hypothetical protein
MKRWLVAIAISAWCGALFAAPFRAEYTVRIEVDATKAAGSSTTDRAAIKAASLLGAVEVGTISDSGSLVGGKFRLSSTVAGHRVVKLVVSEDTLQIMRTSEGEIRQGHLVTTRYSDRRGKREPLVYVADIAKGRYEFRRANTVTGSARLQYSNVDIAALPYLLLGRKPPAAPLSVAYTDGRTVRVAAFHPRPESLRVGSADVATVRLSSVQRTPEDPLIEIWMRASDSVPRRVRVALSHQYGAIADQWITQLPPPYRPS